MSCGNFAPAISRPLRLQPELYRSRSKSKLRSSTRRTWRKERSCRLSRAQGRRRGSCARRRQGHGAVDGNTTGTGIASVNVNGYTKGRLSGMSVCRRENVRGRDCRRGSHGDEMRGAGMEAPDLQILHHAALSGDPYRPSSGTPMLTGHQTREGRALAREGRGMRARTYHLADRSRPWNHRQSYWTSSGPSRPLRRRRCLRPRRSLTRRWKRFRRRT